MLRTLPIKQDLSKSIMRLILDIDKQKTIDYLESKLRTLVSFLYSWLTTNGEVLGYILGIWHIMVCITIPICILLSHTIFPNVLFQLGCFISLFFIWLQHVVLHVCVVFLAEVNLTKKHPPFYTVIEDITGFKLEEYQVSFLLIETTFVIYLFLELIGKFSLYIFDCYTKNAFVIY